MRTAAVWARLVLATAALTLSIALAAGVATAQTGRAPARRMMDEATLVDVAKLPRFATLAHARTVIPLLGGFSLSDSFLVQSWGFDDHTGACNTRGWRGIDLTQQVYASVTDRFVLNQSFEANSSGLGYMPPLVTVGATPVPAAGANVGVPMALSHDATGHLVAIMSTSAVPARPSPVVLRLMPGGWVAFGTTLPDTLRTNSLVYDAAHARLLLLDAASGHLLAMPEAGGPLGYVAGDPAGSPDDTLGIHHNFGSIADMACDGTGTVYFAGPGRIRELRADGRIVTVAGTGVPGSAGDGGPATSAQVQPIALAVSPSGSELVFMEDDRRGGSWQASIRDVRRVDLGTGRITMRNNLVSDLRYIYLQDIAWSGGTYLVSASATWPQRDGFRRFVDSAPASAAVVLRSEGDSLARIAGSVGLADVLTSLAPTPDPRHHGLAAVRQLVDDGAGGAYFSEEFASDFTPPLVHLVPGAPLEVVAGVSVPMAMQSRAFCFGTASPDPEEILLDGFNYWLLSPPISIADPTSLEVRLDGVLLTEWYDINFYLTVEAQLADGSWAPLDLTATTASFDGHQDIRVVRGRFVDWGPGWFKLRARPGHRTGPLPASTRIRVRMKGVADLLPPGLLHRAQFGSPPAPGGAVVDNIIVRDGDGNLLMAPLDFEDGSLGGWTLEALNGHAAYAYDQEGPDFAPPANRIESVASYDFSNKSCVWSVCAGRDSLPFGTQAALVSPWVPVARPDSAIFVVFSGKLTPYLHRGLFIFVEVQTKNAHGEITSQYPFNEFSLWLASPIQADIESPYLDGVSLRYVPPSPVGADSVRVIFSVHSPPLWGTGDEPYGLPYGVPLPTRFPYFDDIRIVQLGSDEDFDGVSNRVDACPGVSAIGQDADGDGCPDPTATLRHVETWPHARLPIVYHLSSVGDPRILDGSSAPAIRQAFLNWKSVTRADVPVLEGSPLGVTNASSTDGINLITFTDPDFQFPDNVVAVTPTLSFARRGSFDDTMYLPGQILDADILFNPAFKYSTRTFNAGPGSFDLESVATHEVGHMLGLSHSGVLDASMFYVLQPGTDGRSLRPDDEATIGAAYPGASFTTAHGTIRGAVTRGSNGEAVPGALVTAVQLSGGVPTDSLASDFTDELGRYALRGLPPGDYGVRITPLDGEVGGIPLTPDDISLRVSNIARTDFDGEWWSPGDSNHDDPNAIGSVPVAAGEVLDHIDVVTNVDTTPPTVLSLLPDQGATGVRIDAPILVRFSERLTGSTFNAQTFVLTRLDDMRHVGGVAYSSENDRAFSFTSTPPLSFGTNYRLTLTTGLTDRQGVPLAADYVSDFRTMDQPPVAITDIQPRQAPVGAFITLAGAGFDASEPAANSVSFTSSSGGPIEVVPTSVTPSAIVVAVPAGAETGDVIVTSDGTPSTGFRFTVLQPGGQPAPSPLGSPIAVGFEPSDVAVSADGLVVCVVGPGGLAVLDRTGGGAAPVVRRFTVGAVRSAVLAPARDLLYATRPDSGDVVAIGADPAAVATFGRIVQRIAVADGGRPDAIAISASGTRVYAGDERLDLVYQVDTDAGSLTRFQVLREMRDTAAVLTGGLALAPGGERLYYTTANAGVRQFRLEDTTGMDLAPVRAEHGAAVSVIGQEAVFAGGQASPSEVLFVNLADPAHPSGHVDLGGSVRDVVITPQGASALAVNATFNRLQVVGLDASSPTTYHERVAEVATGEGPVAVAMNQDGSLVAVANGKGQSVSLYGAGANASLVHIVPPAAVAGARVAMRTSGSLFVTGARGDFGGDLVTPVTLAADGLAAGFVVPTGFQRELAAAAVGTDGRRTANLPFSRLDPVTRFAPAATSYTRGLSSSACRAASPALVLESPDGGVLATARAFAGGCNACVELFEANPGGAFLSPLGTPIDLGSTPAVSGLAFRGDGAELWAVQSARPALLVVGLASGPGFGTLSTTALPGIDPAGLVADPLGRWIMLADRTLNAVMFLDPATRASIGTVALGGEAGPLAVSPDGHWIVCARGGGAAIVDLGTRTIAALTLTHASAPAAIVVTADGRRAVATYPGSNAVAVWNLDTTAGALGQELFFGPPATGLTGAWTQLVTAPDAGGAVVGAPDVSESVRLEVSGATPVATRAPLPAPAATLARSLDGRRLWTVAPDALSLAMFAIDEATALAVVSGQSQAGPPGTLLPLPVGVRITDGSGAGEAGVTVRFALADSAHGALDGHLLAVDARTDENGDASVRWTMPAAPGAVSLAISAAGLAGAPTTLTALCTGSNASIAPVVSELGPIDGASGILADSPMFARFNQAMDLASLEQAVSLTTDGLQLPGTVELEGDGHVAIFRPGGPLPYGATCLWAVSTRAHDTDDQFLQTGASATFTVQSQPTLSLQSVYPPAGPVGTSIALAGTGFSSTPGLNTVRIGGIVAPVATASATELGVVIPEGVPTASVGVTVGVGSVVSTPLTFVVHTTDPSPNDVLVRLLLREDVSAALVAPDAHHFYFANPRLGTLTVAELTTDAFVLDTVLTVGSDPRSLAITPDGRRVYVANTGSHDITVVESDPGYVDHRITGRIAVEDEPLQIAYSASRQELFVLTDKRLSIVDTRIGSGLYHQVTATINTGSSGHAIAITPDGGQGYLLTEDGRLLEIDLSSRAVTATINTGSSGHAIAITPDGGLLVALLADGRVIAIDNVAGSAHFHQVTATINTGSSGHGIAISPDGGSILELTDDGTLYRIQINGRTPAATRARPGPAISLTLASTLAVGSGPGGLLVDPLAGRFVVTTSPGTGEAVLVGVPDLLAPVAGQLDIQPNTINLKSMGRWIKADIELPRPFSAVDIALSSLRLNGVVAADTTAPVMLADGDGDELLELSVPFDRLAVEFVLQEGDSVPIAVTGRVGARTFRAVDVVRVRHGRVAAPHAGEVVASGAPYTMRWETPKGVTAPTVAVLQSLDGGGTWTILATDLANVGSYAWNVPDVVADSVRVAVALIEAKAASDPFVVTGVLATSDLFHINGLSDGNTPPVSLAFSPTRPNPSTGATVFRIGLPVRTHVALEVFDILGRRMRTLVDAERPAGWHEIPWTGTRDHGGAAPAGIYFVRLRALGHEFRQRLVLLQ